MQSQILNLPEGKLAFQAKSGALHVLSQEGVPLLEAFQQRISVDEVCRHLRGDFSPEECRKNLTDLWQQWDDLGLLGAGAVADELPFQLLISPGLETIEVLTNSQCLFVYLGQCYRSVSSAAKLADILSSITVRYKQADTVGLYEISVDGEIKHKAESLERAILAVQFEITEESTHEEPRLLVAHAAALICGRNTWLLPAQAGSGKSTLTATLLKHNYWLINDDVVPVNYDGTVTALNLPLKIKAGAWSILEPLYPELKNADVVLRADELRMKNLAAAQSSSCPPGSRHRVTGIVVPVFDVNQTEPVFEALSFNSKLQAFLQAEPYFPHRLTRPYLQHIIDWLEPIVAWKIYYSNSQQAVQLLEELSSQT